MAQDDERRRRGLRRQQVDLKAPVDRGRRGGLRMNLEAPTRQSLRRASDRRNVDLEAPVGDYDQLDINRYRREANTYQEGLAQGVENLKATVPAIESIGRGLLGDEEGAMEAAREAQETQELGQKLGPQTSFKGVLNGENSFGDYLAGLAGTQTPLLASIFASGGAAGLAGRGVASAATRGVVQQVGQETRKRVAAREAQRAVVDEAKAAGRKVSRSEAGKLGQATTRENFAREQLKKVVSRQRRMQERGAKAGAVAGAGTSISGAVTPETTDIILDEDSDASIRERALAAGGASLFAGAVNTVPVMRLFRNLGLGQASSHLMKQRLAKQTRLGTVARGAAIQTPVEASTEMLEGVGIRVAHKMINEDTELFSDEALLEMLEEGVAGALLGGTLGGATSFRFTMPGPTESATQDRTVRRQKEQKKRKNRHLPEEEQGNRRQPVDERMNKAKTAFVGESVLHSDEGEPASYDDKFSAGLAFRMLIDPDAPADELVTLDDGSQVTAAEQARAVLEERYGIDVDAMVEVAREAMAQGEQFDFERVQSALDEQAEIDRLEETVPEADETSSRATARQELEQELEFRRARLQEILNPQNEVEQVGEIGVEDVFRPDEVDQTTETLDDPNAGIDPRSGDALQNVEVPFRPALTQRGEEAPIISLKQSEGLDTPSLGKVFVGERTRGNNTKTDKAQEVVERLNNESGSSGDFNVAPAGDALIRSLRNEMGLEAAEPATNRQDFQQRIGEEARRLVIDERNNPRQINNRVPEGVDTEALEAIAGIKTELAKLKKKKKPSSQEQEQIQQLERQLNEAPSPFQNADQALDFLNQFDTVVEERLPTAISGRDEQQLGPEQLRRKGIVDNVPDRPLEAHEIQVTDAQGQPQAVNLVSLTQEMISRVSKAGRGGSREARQRAGQSFEQGSGERSISRENIGRAVASGLAELVTNNNYQLGDISGAEQVQQLAQARQQLAELEANAQDTQTSRLEREAAQDEVTRLEQAVANQFSEQINAAVRDDAVAFRTQRGDETTVGGATQQGAASFRAEIQNLTNMRELRRRRKQLQDRIEEIGDSPRQRERLATTREQLREVNKRIRTVSRARRATRRAKEEDLNTKAQAKRLQRLVDTLRKSFDATSASKLSKTIKSAFRRPDLRLREIAAEREAILNNTETEAQQETEAAAPAEPSQISGKEAREALEAYDPPLSGLSRQRIERIRKKRDAAIEKRQNESRAVKMAELITALTEGDGRFDVDQAAGAVQRIYEIVDEFAETFDMPVPDIVFATDKGTSRGQYNPNTHTITFRSQFLAPTGMSAGFSTVIVHEMSHGLEFDAMFKMSPREMAAVAKDYQAWRKQAEQRLEGMTGEARSKVLNELLIEKRGPLGVSKQALEMPHKPKEAYVLDPREWFADNAARMILEDSFNPSENSVALRAFKRLADVLKRVYERVVLQRDFAPQDAPGLRKFLQGLRSASEPQPVKIAERELSATDKARLEQLKAEEKLALRDLVEVRRLENDLDRFGKDDTIKMLRTEIRLFQLLNEMRTQTLREQSASQRTVEDRYADLLRETLKDELTGREGNVVEEMDGNIDNVDEFTKAQNARLEGIKESGVAPPWMSERDAEIPTFKQRRQEATRLQQDLEDAGINDLPVKVVGWAEAVAYFDSRLRQGQSFESVEAYSDVVDGELVVYVNETLTSPSARRAAMNNELGRAVVVRWAEGLTEPQAKAVMNQLGFNGGKSQLMKVLRNRTGSSGALEQTVNLTQIRGLYEALSDQLGKFSGIQTQLVDALANNVGAKAIKDLQAQLEQLATATDSDVAVEHLSSVRGFSSQTGKYSERWTEVKNGWKGSTDDKFRARMTRVLEGEGKSAKRKKAAKKKAAKKKTSTGGGDRGGPPQGPPSPPWAPSDPPTPDDAFNAKFMLDAPFSVEGFYATRDLMASRLTAEERRTLAQAFNAVPVRAQMVKFLKEQGTEHEGFLDDPMNVIALGHNMHSAGLLELEASASKTMNRLHSFAHSIMGILRSSEAAVEVMEALNDGRVAARRSVLTEKAKKGSHLQQGSYSLLSSDMAVLYDMLDARGLFNATKRKDMSREQLRDILSKDRDFAKLPGKVQNQMAEDIKAGVFTKDFLKEMAEESDFTLNPSEQFVLERVVGNNYLQRGARAIAAGLQFFGPMARILQGEAMRARATGNPAIIDLLNSVYTDITSQGRAESMFSRKSRRRGEFDGEYSAAVMNLNDAQLKELHENMLDPNKKITDPEVKKARQKISRFTVKMRNYATEAGLDIGYQGNDYVPWVFNPEKVTQRSEDLVEDWMRPKYKKEWEKLARKRDELAQGAEMSDAQRREMIRRIVNGIATENNGMVEDAGTTNDPLGATTPPKVGAMHTRELHFLQRDKTSSDLLSKVFSDDVHHTMGVYISQMVKRVEYARTFGPKGEKFTRTVNRAKEFGASQQDIELMHSVANSALGRIGLEVGGFWKAVMKPVETAFMKPVDDNGKPFKTAEAAAKVRRQQKIKGRVVPTEDGKGYIIDRAITNDPPRFRQAMAWMIIYQNFRLLAGAALTNTADIAGIFVRTGSANEALRAYGNGIREVFSSIKNRKLPPKERQAQMTELRKLAQELGIVEFSVISDIMGQLYATNMMDGKAKRWNDTLFRYNGMEYLTRTTRMMALAAGRNYLVSKARQAATGNESAVRELAELDLDFHDVSVENGELKLLSTAEIDVALEPYGLTSAGAVDQAVSQQEFDAMQEGPRKQRQRVLRQVARDDRLKRGLYRMVDESVLRPSASQRPTWMNNPNWMLFSHLKGFLFTYHERVLRRGYTQAAQGNYGPMMRLPSYVGMIMAMDLLREVIQHGADGDERKEEWTFGDRLQDGMRRSGVAGVGTFFMDMQVSHQFGSNLFFEAGGPTTSQVHHLWRAFGRGHANMGTVFKRSLPLSQAAVDAPVNWTDYFMESTMRLGLDDVRSLQVISESPVMNQDIQQQARRLLLRE